MNEYEDKIYFDAMAHEQEEAARMEEYFMLLAEYQDRLL